MGDDLDRWKEDASKLSRPWPGVKTNFCELYIFTPGEGLNNLLNRGTAVAQWLRCCATYRKVAGSIPDGVIEIFH